MNNNIRNISFEKTNFSHLNLKNDKDIKVAIYDIIEENTFNLLGSETKEYDLDVLF